ncbi:MAG: glycosyltransferase [Deltaproteobacteria bacterium]|nr:glycosyltransferase [Deltaproteobacteria bacterium]
MDNELTIIVPVFNEEECLPSFFLEMDRFIEATPVASTVLFVNDGSTDRSSAILKDKCSGSSRYKYLPLDGNYGLSTAIKAGIDACDTSLIGYIDADLQTKPEDFLLYFKYFPKFDMVNGIRQGRKDSFVKRFSSKFANAYRRLMINDGIQDTCCPLKIFKASYAKEMHLFDGMHRFMPALIKLQGGAVKQVPIAHYPRYAGTPKYHLWNRLIGPFFDTLAFRWMRSRYISYTTAD